MDEFEPFGFPEDEFLDDYDLFREGELTEKELWELYEQERISNAQLAEHYKHVKKLDPVGLIVLIGVALLVIIACLVLY